jgi:hypothetical protein
VIDAFAMPAFDEDNHHPGVARHLWCPVDPAYRSACECKVSEVVVVDGAYEWTTEADHCRGCDYERSHGDALSSSPAGDAGGIAVSRRMSVSLTLDAVRERRKTVTRRHVFTWETLRSGDRLTLIEKGMGLPKGAKQVVVAEVEVVDVRVEALHAMSDEDTAAEGFPGMTAQAFIAFWLETHDVAPFRSQGDALAYPVRRIEWRYL